MTFRVMHSKSHMCVRQISAMIIKLIFCMKFITSLIFEATIKLMGNGKLIFLKNFLIYLKFKKKNTNQKAPVNFNFNLILSKNTSLKYVSLGSSMMSDIIGA